MRGALAQVKEAVRAIKQITREVFVPLVHRPGEAQADFGHALILERGALRKVVFFVMTLAHSDYGDAIIIRTGREEMSKKCPKVNTVITRAGAKVCQGGGERVGVRPDVSRCYVQENGADGGS